MVKVPLTPIFCTTAVRTEASYATFVATFVPFTKMSKVSDPVNCNWCVTRISLTPPVIGCDNRNAPAASCRVRAEEPSMVRSVRASVAVHATPLFVHSRVR